MAKKVTNTKQLPVPKKGTKSEKILKAFDSLKDISKVSRKLKIHYSFVHTVVRKYR